MELSIYFDPIDVLDLTGNVQADDSTFGKNMRINSTKGDFPDLDKIQIAIIGVCDDRNSLSNKGSADAPDHVRKYLYGLHIGEYHAQIADLGNIKEGNDKQDTYHAVTHTTAELIKNNIVPVIIGGSNDIALANYCGYEKLQRMTNFLSIDSRYDLGKDEDELCSDTYLGKMIMRKPNYLFNYTNIGYQSYFVNPSTTVLLRKMFFDVYRVGKIREDLTEAEPIIRNADMVSCDISAIRAPDAPGNSNNSPNGFYGEEICQIIRYAGMSNKLSSIGFYEFNPLLDRNGQTAHLLAQMVWYFIEGFYSRGKEFPYLSKSKMTKYNVCLKNSDHEIIFYKNIQSQRWWMEIPVKASGSKFERHHMVPCSYKDYELASNDEMPDRWWQIYQRMSFFN